MHAPVNQKTSIARSYHEQTKHSYRSVRTPSRGLDWSNRPLPFKIYHTIDPLPLPNAFGVLAPALDAVASDGRAGERQAIPSLQGLARIFHLSNGITRVRRLGGSAHALRAASCTGALYHIELYLVCGDLPGLSAGVYHYGAHDHALRRLRAGDFRSIVVRAAASHPPVARAPALIICADTFWRNAWKYRARAYRHSGWDGGVILANLLATAAALELPAHIVCGFADGAINHLVGVDGRKEASIALVTLGRETPSASDGGMPANVSPLDLPITPLSRTEVEYPLIQELHSASSLAPGEVAHWRGGPAPRAQPPPYGPLLPLPEVPSGTLPRDTLEAVISRRGSSRRFTQQPISAAHLSTLLTHSTRGIPADFLEPPEATLNDVYVIVNAVDGVPPGGYVYHREGHFLEQVRQGEWRERAEYLALEQALARDAAVNIYYLAALDPILARFGNRGYRAVQLEAGIRGGKVYLIAYALGLGATGLTFYDDDVTGFFSPHATGKSVIFLVAVGHPWPRRGRKTVSGQILPPSP